MIGKHNKYFKGEIFQRDLYERACFGEKAYCSEGYHGCKKKKNGTLHNIDIS